MIEWSAADIPDLTGRVAVVTGANSGIGLETTAELAGAGAHVIMACRHQGRGDEARQRIADRYSGQPRTEIEGRLTVWELDLTKPESIRRFAARLTEHRPSIADDPDRRQGRPGEGRLDLLINNAGVMACPPELTEQGIERQWASNHLGHFALTGLLLPHLTERARVVSVSSLAAAGGDLSRPILTSIDDYSRFQVYSDTKLANQVFAVELNHRLAAAGRTAISVVSHPGLAHTNLGAGLGLPLVSKAMLGFSRLLTQSAAHGALPTIRAATDPRVEGGQYYGPSGRHQHRGWPKQISLVNGAARRSLGRELWAQSMELSGVRYLAGS